jgi:hypothetical protein
MFAPKGMTNIAKDFSVSNFYGHYWGFHLPFTQASLFVPIQTALFLISK